MFQVMEVHYAISIEVSLAGPPKVHAPKRNCCGCDKAAMSFLSLDRTQSDGCLLAFSLKGGR